SKKQEALAEEKLLQRAMDTWVGWKLDQPITTPSERFSVINYGLVAYFKTAYWLQEIEQYIGRDRFDEAMRSYYDTWKFRHPSPEDFRKILEEKSGKDVSRFFESATRKESRPVS